jgi:hypothetical protein
MKKDVKRTNEKPNIAHRPQKGHKNINKDIRTKRTYFLKDLLEIIFHQAFYFFVSR